ncbi:MAG: serine--tRNA ligase [Bacteroidota bacterium]
MLSLSFIRDNKDLVIKRLHIKNFNQPGLIEALIEKDEKRRKLQAEADSKQSQLKSISKDIGSLLKEGKKDEAEKAKEKTGLLKESLKDIQKEQNSIQEELNGLLVQIPNLPHESVPPGDSEADNELIRSWGDIDKLPDGALPHWELSKKYDIIDFELGNKITGSGFPLYKGKAAKLQRALINFFLDENNRAGYQEFLPPLLVNEASGFGTGQLPDKEGQMYHVVADNLYLIPTAEVPITNIYRDMILDESDLPVKSTAYTPCFRREAGSYGKDVRGLNRLHQFDKVEIVQICHPDNSYNILEEMVEHVESLIKKLELPYRILKLCGGDIGFTSALTYDFEVYSAAQEKWLEVSSVSNFVDYQANRLKLRFRDNETKKTRTAHTLNGSALALPRIVAALLENNQTKEGIKIPEILRPFTGFDSI